MANDFDYAWMAAAAYSQSREPAICLQPAFGWDQIDSLDVPGAESGFAAKVYQQVLPQGWSRLGEIVIAFRSTTLEWKTLNAGFQKDCFSSSYYSSSPRFLCPLKIIERF